VGPLKFLEQTNIQMDFHIIIPICYLFLEYFQVVTDSLNTYPSDMKCSNAVQKAMQQVKDSLSKKSFVEKFKYVT
jgi:hypothetical protein